MSAISVYGLKAPGSDAIRYVGKSANPRDRAYSHTSDSAAASVREWVASLDSAPVLAILETLPDDEQARVAEQKWIKKLLSDGAELLNVRVEKDFARKPRAWKFAGLGGRVSKLRRELGLSQVDFAAVVGIDSGTMSRVETGSRPHISAELAVLIARALKCSVEWLVTGEE